jgi:YD repeat-containing protein
MTVIRTINYGYDAADRLTSASDPDSTYAMEYNLRGELVEVDNTGTPGLPDVLLTMAYGASGKREEVYDNFDVEINYVAGDAERLTEMLIFVEASGEGYVNFDWDHADRLTGIERLPALQDTPVNTSLAYDEMDRVTEIVHSAAFDAEVVTEGGTGVNEVQTVEVDVAQSAGSFRLKFGTQTTADLADDASAAAVDAALEALSSIGTGNVSVTGSAGGPWTVTFIGALAEQDVALLLAISSPAPRATAQNPILTTPTAIA